MKVLATVHEVEQVVGGSPGRGIGSWIRGSLDRAHAPVARARYSEYRQRRDRSGDRAAQARSRSRSDMNDRQAVTVLGAVRLRSNLRCG
ncbi:hypothetical protein VCRA2133O313_320014 [Vibrio crassostreae]|nr:hypothetical protein EDB58_11516 [Vibrio crassostreae]TCT59304.1 hypothetical protein EDB44_11734 [Vibrio crassostreae]TCT80462.1 hypothetical protein EDB43_11775 [Vibrio crassostreae]TCU00452.1 hypothetical protein EDB47_12314 [Vibrio crassostreae]TDW07169.1 hypothetical protein EDB45_11775 [Vibrio crassostreae]